MWRKPQGYAVFTDRETGKKTEYDTRQCAHCQTMHHIKPGVRPEDIGGLCGVCSKLICPTCVGKPCDEIQRKLDRAEASHHARRSYGI